MSLREAAIACNRFGLGARPGDLAAVAADPRGWLVAQLGVVSAPVPELAGFAPSGQVVREVREARRDAKDKDARKDELEPFLRAYREELAARCLVAARSEAPFRERLVRFWSNHLCVSSTRGEVRPIAGAYEREAIRPHVCAGFRQLLMAAERHPAMQLYLDNARSIGPDSPFGERSGRGLNENHAREILELHTLGVNGGYTQDDVEALAAILTGWGLVRGRDNTVTGAFTYDPLRHQPGAKRLLGQVFPEAGEAEGKAALEALARHPATARHLATKLVRHFVADEPPERAVDAITRTFQDTGGNLAEVGAALVALPEAWDSTLSKLKTPEELVISTARGLGYATAGEPMLKSVAYLGQMPFAAPSPQGWPDRAADWLGPEAILTRVEWAEKVGSDAGPRIGDVAGRADDLLGPLLTDRTRQAISGAATSGDAVALLVASPEFQRR